MDRATHEHRTPRRGLVVLTTLVLVAGMFAVLAPGAGAVANTCQARNLTKGTPVRTNLQRVIKAASAGDTISVKNVCVGNFKIGKRLTLSGKSTPKVAMPVLHANGSGRVLTVTANVRLNNLKITGGTNVADENTGGILVDGGTLTLTDTVVRGNQGTYAGGVFVGKTSASTLRINGDSSIIDNTGTGIYVGNWGSLVMNDTSQVSSNEIGILTYYADLVTLNDEVTIAGNDAGIINQFSSLTMNSSSSVRENVGVGISNFEAFVNLEDSSTVSGNGAGGVYTQNGSFNMYDSSSVTGNSLNGAGGGIYARSQVILSGDATVSGNTANADDSGGEEGGGIFVTCTGSLIGAVDGGNVNDNYVGTTSPVEDNIAFETCP